MDLIQEYSEYRVRKKRVGILLFILIICLFLIAINIGPIKLDYSEILSYLKTREGNIASITLFNIRLPRVLAAIVAGAGLAMAGCIMQTNLRNPLASPSTLGISNAAAFGANVAIILFGAGQNAYSTSNMVSIQNPYIVTISALIGSMTAAAIILGLASLKQFSPEAIVLAGVALSSLFNAGITLIQYFADDVQVAAAVFWTFGDLGRISWSELILLTVTVLLAFIFFHFKRWDYNAMTSGDLTAKSLGVKVQKTRIQSMFFACLITSVCVAFMGNIAFIGLVAPQIIRRVLGNDHSHLIPISTLMGAVLLLASDTIARTIISPVILPVGAVTSFLGAPLFLYILMKGGQK